MFQSSLKTAGVWHLQYCHLYYFRLKILYAWIFMFVSQVYWALFKNFQVFKTVGNRNIFSYSTICNDYIILSLLKIKIKKIRFTYKKSTISYIQVDEFWQIQIHWCNAHNNHDIKTSPLIKSSFMTLVSYSTSIKFLITTDLSWTQ